MKKVNLIILLSFLFIATSCTNLLSSPINTPKNGLVSLSLSTKGIPKVNSSSKSRSATSSQLSELYYEVIATATENSEVIFTQNFQNDEEIIIQVTPSYKYNIKVNAKYKNATNEIFTIYEGEILNVNPLNNAPVTIQMEPKTEYESHETGSLKLQLYKGEGSFTGYKISVNFFNKNSPPPLLYNYTGTSEITDITKADFSSTYSISAQNLVPGTYGMKLYFYSSESDDSFIGFYPTDFTIYAGMETNTWVNDDFFVNGDGHFTFTKAIEEKLENSVFYVRGTGATNFPTGAAQGLDTNRGTVHSPLATVSAAINKCTLTEKDYVIYVDGTITHSTMSTIASNKKITIKSINSENKAKIHSASSFTNSCFNVSSNGALTLQDVELNGEGVTCTTDGGCINSSGTLTLANCEVKNFSSSGASGGAIYSNGGAVQATNCTFQQNTVNSTTKGNGGAVYFTGGNLEGTENKFENCVFTQNSATSTESLNSTGDFGTGGAIYIGENTTVKIKNGSSFNSNNASHFGGAIGTLNGTIELSDVTIIECSARSGGGIYHKNSGDDTKEFSITNTRILKNTATRDGGGISVYSKVSINASDCYFAENGVLSEESSYGGGALYANETGYNRNPHLFERCKFGRCTIDGIPYGPNTCNGFGGAIHLYVSYAIFDNCIIGNVDKVNENFASSRTQVQKSQCATLENSGNIAKGSGTAIYVYDPGKTILRNGTKVCYNYADDDINVIGAPTIIEGNDITIGQPDDTNPVEIYGNTSYSIVDAFMQGSIHLYGKIHHNSYSEINKSYVVTITSGGNFYMYPSSEITNNLLGGLTGRGFIRNNTIQYYANFIMTGGIINGNSNKDLNFYEVYLTKEGVLKIEGNSVIGGQDYTNKYDCIYTESNEPIKITNNLTNNFVARIDMPDSSYVNEKQILTGDVVGTNYSKFEIFKDNVTLNNEGKLIIPSDEFYSNALNNGERQFDVNYSAAISNLLKAIKDTNIQEEVTLTLQNNISLGETDYLIPSNSNITFTSDTPITFTSNNTKQSPNSDSEYNWYTFVVQSGATLNLSGNITFDGLWNGNVNSTIQKRTFLNCYGTVNMDENITIKNFYGTNGSGALFVQTEATFNMNNGTIDSCYASVYGGVCYLDGTFNMNGGTITNCGAKTYDYLFCQEGKLNITGGTITNSINELTSDNWYSARDDVNFSTGMDVNFYEGFVAN